MSNSILDRALGWSYEAYTFERGLQRVVAYGDHSGKCPTYVKRVAPCSDACPAGEDIRGINNILRGKEEKGAEDRYEAAFRRLAQKNPFPFVMGQVCPAPCQDACNRGHRDETVAINALEHFLGDYAIRKGLKFEPADFSTGKSVGIVGSGPAGLSCAYQARRMGHAVSIYEMNSEFGGMMRYGTLGYRVSRSGLDAEIGRIIDMGVDARSGVKVGAEISLEDLRAKHDAIFIGVGAQLGKRLPIPGADGASVLDTIAFLKEYETTGSASIGKNVAVIGDGDVAMDAARLALRLGSKATILSGVGRDDMNCSAFEYDEALAEGAGFELCRSVKEVLRSNGSIRALKVVETVKKEKGEEGWNHAVPFFRYKEKADSESEFIADTLIFAIGQSTDMSGLEAATGGADWLKVDANFQVERLEGVFGGGDAIKIDLITTAIGHGRMAAESIDRYLRSESHPRRTRSDVVGYHKLKSDYFVESPKSERTHLPIERVEGNFDPFLEPIGEGAAQKEAERCMSCGLCFECDQCMLFCPQDAIVRYRSNPVGEVMFTKYENCVGCHICAEVCPTGYIDMGMGE